MKFKQSEISDGIFEVIRKAVVAGGYLPDFVSAGSSSAYQSAKGAIISSGKEVIEVFNVGTYKSKGEDMNNNIIINRASVVPAKIGTGKEIAFVQNDNGTFDKIHTPDTRYDIMYSISYNTISEKYAEIIEDIILNAFESRKFIRAVRSNGDIIMNVLDDYNNDLSDDFGGSIESIENVAGFWLMNRGFVDTSGTNFIEKQWRFEAINIDLIGWKNIDTVPQLVQFDFALGTEPNNTNAGNEDLFNIDLEI
ncbi:MAG TPA: hypothetical protein PLJ18_11510 [Niabella sp.]|nr:hypothetical protein [Bacteroidia bacterium]HOZ90992.1 hypothetical protein [Bacteroidia bacterium]HRB52091.1 hypothetical protein [Bacteroidia bacterium]HRC03073.1 hypothetical protein [Niabella sp.]